MGFNKAAGIMDVALQEGWEKIMITSAQAQTLSRVHGLSLAEINHVWNQNIKQVTEPPGEDVWQTPAETVALGTGDCEDLAIAKFFSIPAWHKKDLHIVRLEDGQVHMYTVVDDTWVLDVTPHVHRLDGRPSGEQFIKSVPNHGTDPRWSWLLSSYIRGYGQNLAAIYAMLHKVQL